MQLLLRDRTQDQAHDGGRDGEVRDPYEQPEQADRVQDDQVDQSAARGVGANTRTPA